MCAMCSTRHSCTATGDSLQTAIINCTVIAKKEASTAEVPTNASLPESDAARHATPGRGGTCNDGGAGGAKVAEGGGAREVHDDLQVPYEAPPYAGADRLAQQPPALGALRRPRVLWPAPAPSMAGPVLCIAAEKYIPTHLESR